MSELLKYYTLFRDRLKNRDNKKLFENFIALVFLQIANYALPLIILPHLTKVLHPDNYGKLAWAQYAIQFLVILTDYGFYFSATRQVSLAQNDPKKISSVFNAVMCVKFFLLLVSFGILFSWIRLEGFNKEEASLLYVTFFVVAGNMLFPLWLFQGLEKMKWVTIINVVTKTIFALSVFFLVREKEAVITAAALNSAAFVLTGLAGLWIAVSQFKIKLYIPRFSEMVFQFRDGWFIFLSTIYTALYVHSNGFILGFMGNDTMVGYYSPGEKIVRAIASLFNPVMFAFFPFISKKFGEDFSKGIRTFFFFFRWVCVLGLFCSLALYFGAEYIAWIFGDEYKDSVEVIQWLSVIPFFGTAGAMLSYQLFLNTGLKKWLPYILFSLAVADILLCIFLIPEYGHRGAAIALCIVEVLAPLIYLAVYYLFGPEAKKNVNLPSE